MALKFNCCKCGEIIVVRSVKPGVLTNCGKCRATNLVPDSAIEITNEQADVYSKPPPKGYMAEAPAKTAVKAIENNEPNFKKALKYCYWGVGIGTALSFFVPKDKLYLYGMDSWMVVVTAAFLCGVIGFITGELMNTERNISVPKNRYPALRVIIGYYRILAGIVIVLTAIICVSVFFAGPGGYFLLRLLAAMIICLLGAALYVTLRATAEGITVILDIEDNTRKTRGTGG